MIVLASTSRYRRELLDRLGLPFAAEPHAADENTPETTGDPVALVVQLAARKAESLAVRHASAHILGSDQIAELEGRVLGKPGSAQAAAEMLETLAGRTHRLVTGVALKCPDGAVRTAVDIHLMTMRQLSRREIERYVQRDQPLDCAGGYKIERAGIGLFESISGADFTAIVGLPMIAVVSMLRAEGFPVP